MGQEIKESRFTNADRDAFREKLRDETATLKQWFDQGAFDHADKPTIGLELEGWLIDENCFPSPQNEAFFDAANDPDIVAELSRFNFEINAPPYSLGSKALEKTRNDLDQVWTKCQLAAKTLGLRPAAIGILPTVRDDMLQPDWMSNANRYRALNAELFHRRGQKPLHIQIKGQDELDYRCDHIMLEAACTSLQAHIKINQEDAVRFYNASILAAGPLVAATANSPFLYGQSLWAETRIPAFEQATALEGFPDIEGRNVGRVTLGTGYLRNSFLELFLENLSYPPLLPARAENGSKLPHLRLQNGTIWRWVRPILGFDDADVPHLRIEHRVMPAGPSIADTVANLALCHGLVLALARDDRPPEMETTFEDARANFYACARDGLNGSLRWAGKTVNVQSLLLEQLIPAARRALASEDLDESELEACFLDVLIPRMRSGRTGTEWQRAYISRYGANFQALTERYVELQEAGEPVHAWTI